MSDDEGADAATVCPFCAVGCTLEPGDGDRTRARGVPGPANPDGHLCPKGIGAFDALADDDRLTTPLVRDREGDLRPASWSTALDRAADGLAAVVDDHGADALGFLGAPHCTNEENYLLQKLARTLGTNNVDNRARLCHASAMTSLETRIGRPAMTNSLPDLATADVILAIGTNPADQQPIAFDSYVRPAVDDGTTLVHVDPRRNRTTRKAAIHLAPYPGADALLVTLLCALVVEAALVDEGFVAERTHGYEAYVDELSAIDVDSGAAAADVAVDALEDVARRFGEADRAAVVAGTGIEEAGHRETNVADALINLLLLTGNLGRPGTGMNVFRGVSNEQGATDAGCRPDRLPGHQSVADSGAREAVAAEWGIEPPSTPGLDERGIVERFGDGVHGALVVGENPVVEKRDPAVMTDRLDALSTLVVVDLFESETTEFADVVLPAASGLEKSGTVTNLDRRVQRLRPTVSPPGDARPDFEILRALGRRLVGDAFEFADPAAAFAEWTRLSPVHSGMTLDAVADGGVQWPVRDGGGGTSVLYEDGFETPDGRASFVTVDADVSRAEDDGLALLVESRVGGFAAAERVDRRLHVSAADAAARDLADGDPVVVETEATAVETTVHVDENVREGTTLLHASVADPLVRDGNSVVRVRAPTDR